MKIKKILIICLLLFVTAYAEKGTVNIFTGDANAEIFIDGEFVAKEQVVKRPLDEGSHYLQVKKGGRVLKSQEFSIVAGSLKTVVADDFVDYKTTVASRGAIDVEALRVRETRGNVGFGLYGGSPASGLSLKWWVSEKFGLQAIGLINNFSGNVDSRGGARLLYSLNESVYKGSTLTTYGALGFGRSMIRNYQDGEKNETYDLSEVSLGVEFKLANFFGEQNEYKHVVIDSETDPFSYLFSQFIMGIGEGFMKFAHISMEIGIERMFTRIYDDSVDEASRSRVAGKFSGGFHVYF